ncbi:MAG: hypothetical protein FWD57_04345 [Polyangiaceae bacterium]|nr:hypothetical protein [Polyangiaceae bacterium]
MRYLYGDSAPFPVQFDYLSSFEGFLEAAVDAAMQASRLGHDTHRAIVKQDAAAVAQERALGTVEQFHQSAMSMLGDLLRTNMAPSTTEYVEQLRKTGEQVLAEARSVCRASVEDLHKAGVQESGPETGDLRSVVERCLKTEVVPSVGWACAMRLVDNRCELSTVFNHPGRIVSSFVSKPMQGSLWNSPVHVGSLLPGLDLQIGVQKNWITGSVSRSTLSLDDYVVGGFDLNDDAADIFLRKRADRPDSFLFKLDNKGVGIMKQLDRDVGEEDVVVGLDASEIAALRRLWQIIKMSVNSTVNLRGQLSYVRVDGHDLFANGLVRTFIERLVRSIAPTVLDIIAHSPNPAELSMKIEDEQGRREEIYIRRETLAAKIDELDEEGQTLFAELGICGDALTSTDLETAE